MCPALEGGPSMARARCTADGVTGGGARWLPAAILSIAPARQGGEALGCSRLSCDPTSSVR